LDNTVALTSEVHNKCHTKPKFLTLRETPQFTSKIMHTTRYVSQTELQDAEQHHREFSIKSVVAANMKDCKEAHLTDVTKSDERTNRKKPVSIKTTSTRIYGTVQTGLAGTL
jgi:hypothetical protein